MLHARGWDLHEQARDMGRAVPWWVLAAARAWVSQGTHGTSPATQSHPSPGDLVLGRQQRDGDGAERGEVHRPRDVPEPLPAPRLQPQLQEHGHALRCRCHLL